MPGTQTTIGESVVLSGVGVHGGRAASMRLNPADPDTGIVFHSLDPAGGTVVLKALSGSVGATAQCTVVGDPRGIHVATIEHLMAALYALGVDNLIVEVDSAELPILDGSASMIVEAVDQAGIVQLGRRRRSLRVLRPLRVEQGGSWAEFSPYERARFEVTIDFDSPAIGRQTFEHDLDAASFRRDVSRARTFGFMKDVERFWAAGFALGSSLENSIVIGDDHRIINMEGLRYADEFVRHKTLDAIGDVALLGAPLLGCFRSHRGGHALNAAAVRALLADQSAHEYVDGAPTHGRPLADKRVASVVASAT